MKSEIGNLKSEIKERPMLFGTPMVQAILEGRKTQTRRIRGLELINQTPGIFKWSGWKSINGIAIWIFTAPGHEDTVGGEEPGKIFVQCPYGQVGDLLWVRETWCNYPYAGNDGASGIILKADKKNAADWGKVSWKPSIHMKKEDAQRWLEITDIRVERLQDISEEYAKAEGIESYFNDKFQEDRYKDYSKAKPGCWKPSTLWDNGHSFSGYGEWRDPISSFQSLWQSINGPGSWDANPWVWVVEFKKINK